MVPGDDRVPLLVRRLGWSHGLAERLLGGRAGAAKALVFFDLNLLLSSWASQGILIVGTRDAGIERAE